jgi:hypothetical protein
LYSSKCHAKYFDAKLLSSMEGDMKKSLLFVLALVFGTIISTPPANAEEVREDWVRSESSYDTNLGAHYSTIGSIIVKTDASNNVYVAGTSEDYYQRYKTIKYDKSGNKLWERKFTGGYNQRCYPMDMAQDEAGNVYLTGNCRNNAGYFDIYTIKYDSNGTLLWQASYDGGVGGSDFVRTLAVDGNGNVYIAGQTSTNRGDYLVIKYDAAGNQAWSASYHAGSFLYNNRSVISSDVPNAIAVDGSGNVYVAGATRLMPASYPTTEYALVKFDSSGNQLWVRTYPAPVQSQGEEKLVVDGDGNTYLLGGQGILVKYDTYGNQLWNMQVPNAYHQTGNLALGRSGNIYVGISEIFGSQFYPYNWKYNYKTLKIDPNGAVLWAVSYGSPIDVATTLVLDDDENVYVTGHKNWVYSTIKYDAQGNLLWDIQSPAGSYPTSIAVDNERSVYVSGGTFAGNGYAFRMTTVKYIQPEYNKAPNADAGLDQTIECGGPEGAAAALDGSKSSDPNGDSLSYSWTWMGGAASGVNLIVTLPLGATTVTLTVDDGKGGTVTDTVTITVRDTTPPVTTVRSIAGIVGDNGWYRSDVMVTVDSADSCSGVRAIRYGIDGSTSTAPGSTAVITVRGDGAHSVTFSSTDNSGNVEQPRTLTINIDKTPPVITASVSPVPNANGWHNTDVTVTFTCSDGGSGITSCTQPVTVTTEGANQTISGAVVDNAGNTASASVTLNIDKTAPSGEISVTPGLLWPPNHKMVDAAVNGGSSDAVSGVASVVFTVIDEYGTVQPAVSGFNTVVPLEAWREGTDMDGRHYTITAVITDKAGNRTTVTTAVVCPHDMKDKQ